MSIPSARSARASQRPLAPRPPPPSRRLPFPSAPHARLAWAHAHASTHADANLSAPRRFLLPKWTAGRPRDAVLPAAPTATAAIERSPGRPAAAGNGGTLS